MTVQLKNYLTEDDTATGTLERVESTVDLQHHIETLDREMSQLEGAVESLESLREIMGTMDEASERETALIQHSVRTLLADTRVSVEALLPGYEETGVVNLTASLEASGNVVQRMIKAVLAFMKKIFDYVKDFFVRVTSNNETLLRQNTNMRERMEVASKGTLQQKKVEMSSDIRHLTVNGKPPKNGDGVIEGLKTLRVQSDVIFKDYTATLVKAGEEIASAIESYDVEKPDDSLKRVYEASKLIDVKRLVQLTKGKVVSNVGWGPGELTALDPLPGDLSIYVYHPVAVGTDNTLSLSEYNRGIKILIDTTGGKLPKSPKAGTFNTITPAQGYEIHRLNKELLTMVGDYGKYRTSIDRTHRRVIKAVEKMESINKKMADQGTMNNVYFNEVISYGREYTRWVKDPHVKLVTTIHNTVRAGIIACNHSAKNYRQL